MQQHKMIILSSFLLLFAFSALSYTSPIESEASKFAWIPEPDGTWRFVSLEDVPPPLQRFTPDNDIIYYLHTRNNPTSPQIIKKGDVASLQESNFDISKPVKVTIHGWLGDYTSDINGQVRDAFLNNMDVNVINVDWGAGASGGYIGSVRNVPLAAVSVAGLLDWLNTLGVSFSNIHLIGHSLGGQMVGIAARSVQNGQVEYVTGLDPAEPLWGSNSERIRKTDAKYVEIIHTDAGLQGMTDVAGHNDFYPNGGSNMPGCLTTLCSHARVIDYFAESIDIEGFTATQCASQQDALKGPANCQGPQKLYMGGSKIKPEYGIFGLTTNSNPPYNQG